MRRGEIWWAEFPKPVGRRPVVILSRTRAVQVREYVTIATVTSVIRNIPVEVALGPEDGLPKKCVVNLDVINTIPKKVLKNHLATLTPAKMEAVESALKFAFSLA